MSLQRHRLSTTIGRKHNARSIVLKVCNSQSPSLLLVQVQARGMSEIFHNLNLAIDDLEVSFDGFLHLEAVLDVLVDAVCWHISVASVITRDNAHLQLLETTVAVDTADDHVLVGKLGDQTIELRALEVEGMVLFDGRLGDTIVLLDAGSTGGIQARLNDIEPLPGVIRARRLQRHRVSTTIGRKHNARSIVLKMCNSQSPACLLVQVQARGCLEIAHNLNQAVDDLEVSFDGFLHLDAVLDVLVDAV